RYSEALETLEQATDTYRAHGQRDALARSMAAIAWIHSDQGTVHAGLARLLPLLGEMEAAEGMGAAQPSSALAALYVALAPLYYASARYKDYLATMDRAVEAARSIQDGVLLAHCEQFRANALYLRGDLAGARHASQSALAAADGAGNLSAQIYAYHILSFVCRLTGDLAQAGEGPQRALELAARGGDLPSLTYRLRLVGLDAACPAAWR